MASTNVSKLIDIESPDESRLQFQEFPIHDTSSVAKLDVNSQSISFTDPVDLPGRSNSDDDLPDSFDNSAKYQTASMFSIEYYQRLFDVNTDEVVDRIIWSMIPRPKVNYLQHYIGAKPDLYGPFWICITLIFTIAISGNIANYFQTVEKPLYNYHWKYDFHIVSFAASAIFAYAWVLPVILWAIIKWQGNDPQSPISLMELLCVYGYSLAVYIPISVLWLIQVGWLQWLLVLVGAATSGTVLLTAVWPTFRERSAFLLAAILAFHLLLATGFMLYFFHVTPSAVEYGAAAAAATHHPSVAPEGGGAGPLNNNVSAKV